MANKALQTHQISRVGNNCAAQTPVNTATTTSLAVQIVAPSQVK